MIKKQLRYPFGCYDLKLLHNYGWNGTVSTHLTGDLDNRHRGVITMSVIATGCIC